MEGAGATSAPSMSPRPAHCTLTANTHSVKINDRRELQSVTSVPGTYHIRGLEIKAES